MGDPQVRFWEQLRGEVPLIDSTGKCDGRALTNHDK